MTRFAASIVTSLRSSATACSLPRTTHDRNTTVAVQHSPTTIAANSSHATTFVNRPGMPVRARAVSRNTGITRPVAQ